MTATILSPQPAAKPPKSPDTGRHGGTARRLNCGSHPDATPYCAHRAYPKDPATPAVARPAPPTPNINGAILACDGGWSVQ